MKKLLYWILGICAALACLGTAGFLWVKSLITPEAIASATEKATGHPLLITKKPQLDLFPPVLGFSSATWQGQIQGADISMEIGACEISLEPWPLFGGDVVIREIILDSPEIKMQTSASSQKTGSKRTKSEQKRTLIPIKRIVVQNGVFHWLSPVRDMKFANINLIADMPGGWKEANLQCDFTSEIVTAGQQNDGNMAIKGNLRYYPPNLIFRQASATYTPLKGPLPPLFSPLRLSLDGALDLDSLLLRLGEAKLSTPQGELSVRGEYDLNLDSFHGRGALALNLERCASLFSLNGIKKEAALVGEGSLSWTRGQLIGTDFALKCGDCPGTGKFHFILPQGGSPLSATAVVNMGFLKTDSIFEEIIREKSIKREESQKPESVWPALDLSLELEGAAWEKLTLTQIKAELSGKDGHYRLEPFEFAWANGQVKASLDMDLVNYARKFTATAVKINLGDALSQTGLPGVKGGVASLSSELSSTGANWTGANANLDGALEVSCRDVQLDLLAGVLKKLPIPASVKPALTDTVKLLEASCIIKNEILTIKSLRLSATGLSATGEAVYNIRNNTIEGKLDAKTLDVNLPLKFQGPLNDISWNLDSGWLNQLKRLLP